MNTAQLKTYAPEARTAFMAAVTAQAARYGVKVNYGKFGTLLAEVKAVHGKKPE